MEVDFSHHIRQYAIWLCFHCFVKKLFYRQQARYTKTCIAHDVISELGSQNEVEDPPKRSRGHWRPGRDQTPQGKAKVVDARPTGKPSVGQLAHNPRAMVHLLAFL